MKFVDYEVYNVVQQRWYDSHIAVPYCDGRFVFTAERLKSLKEAIDWAYNETKESERRIKNDRIN